MIQKNIVGKRNRTYSIMFLKPIRQNLSLSHFGVPKWSSTFGCWLKNLSVTISVSFIKEIYVHYWDQIN